MEISISSGMIPVGVAVYAASRPVDFRKGLLSLMALVRDGGIGSFYGVLYTFRSKRSGRVKIVRGVVASSARMPRRTRRHGSAAPAGVGIMNHAQWSVLTISALFKGL